MFATVLARGRTPPAPHLRLALWCSLLIMADVLNLAVMVLHGNNLWTSYFTLPLEVGMSLWILSSWPIPPRVRRAYGWIIVAMVLGGGAALAVTDPGITFEVWISPMLALLALAASIHTLVHNSLTSHLPLTRQDWFGISLGLSLFWVLSVPMPPFATAAMSRNIDWVVMVYTARAWVMILSFVLMSWGVLCSRRQTA